MVKTKITIDRAGRVVIPKPVRDKLHLSQGDTLELEIEAEDIILRPVHAKGTMVKEKGMWVIKTGKVITLEETNALREAIYKERERRFWDPEG